MKNSQLQGKACLTREMLHIFCDNCIKTIEKDMRPNMHFDKAGREYIISTFKDQVGNALTKAKLKNK